MYLNSTLYKIKPIRNKEEQNIENKSLSQNDLNKFKELNNYGEYPIDFLFGIIKLFIIKEKIKDKKKFMSKKLIESLSEEKDIFSLVSIIS